MWFSRLLVKKLFRACLFWLVYGRRLSLWRVKVPQFQEIMPLGLTPHLACQEVSVRSLTHRK
jgi:hypothetical protein